ncbi:MAG: universal stress protein, partial [Deltaproteobacteria bacterium]
MFPTLLVMLALDHRDESVLDAVIAGAPAMGCRRIVLAHVFNVDPYHAPLAEVLPPEEYTSPPELDLAAERVTGALPDVEVTTVCVTGVPEAEIAALVESHDVDLVVLGRNRAEGGKPGWGSSGNKLLRLIPCSALVVPHGSRLDLSRAVVGLDFSACSKLAMQVADRLAEQVVAVYHFHLPRAKRNTLRNDELVERVRAAAQAHLETGVVPLLQSGRTPQLEVVGTGKVAEALIAEAGDGLLIVGSRGITPVAWLLLGSAANRVAARAAGPVLV